jgi:hypothetical protein
MSGRTRPEAVQRLAVKARAYRQAHGDASVSDAEVLRLGRAYEQELNMSSKQESQAADAQLRRERSGSS